MPIQVFRLPDFYRESYDPVAQRTLVRQLELWLTSLGSEVNQLQMSGGTVVGDYAPLVHQHALGDIPDLASTYATKAEVAALNWNSLADVNVTSSPGLYAVRYTGAEYVLEALPPGGGLTSAYTRLFDGSQFANASGADVIRFRSADNKLSINVFENDPSFGDNVRFTINQGNIDHDALASFESIEHIDHSAVVLTAGTGLTGGGDISASRTFNLADTAVTPGSYGTAAEVPQFTVDQQGRLTLAANVAIAIDAAAVVSGQFADALVQESNVTQHEAALTIDWPQLTSLPDFATRWADWTEVTNKPALYTQAEIDEFLLNYNPVENGFISRTDTTISFDDGTRTFTITPTGADFEFWSAGNRFIKSAPDTLVIPDIEGIHFIYYDDVGDLQVVQVFNLNIIATFTFVAAVYWDATNNVSIIFGDERHGRQMDSATHLWAHASFGSLYGNGFQPGNLSMDGNGNSAAHAQMSLTGGQFRDEDITHNIVDGSPQELEPLLQAPVLYRSGATGDWRKIAATNFPVTTAGTGRAAYNLFSGGVWSLAEASNNNYVLIHLFATNDTRHPIVSIVGQNQYVNLGEARTAAPNELGELQFGAMASLLLEFIPIATFIVQTASGMSNAVKSAFRTTEEGDDFIDWREQRSVSGSGAASSNHSNLSGLGNDDHPQYPNIATAETISGLWTFNTHPLGLDHGTLGGLGDDDHTQYYNQTRGDLRYRQLSVSVPWADLTDIPAFASRWPDWTEVTGKPLVFPPDTHTHADADIIDVDWSKLLNVPSFASRWPTYAEVTDKPATFAPSAHVLATAAGLGPEHTVSGLTEGHVLRATGLTTAAFQALIAADIPSLAASKITSGTFDSGRISEASVTQHQGALSIAWGQLTSVPAVFPPDTHTHVESDITDLGDYEPALGNPGVSGYVLSSTTGGVRSWIEMTGGGGGALGDLTDVTLTSPAIGHFLRYNGTAWLNTLLGTADIPSLDASKIGSGTFDDARIPSLNTSKLTAGTLGVARGGTGISSFTIGNYLRASAATTLEQRTPAQVLSDIGAAASSHTHGLANITDFGAAGGYIRSNGAAWGRVSGLAWADVTGAPAFITGNQTITLSGDASGSGTTSIAVTVADDSHNHIIGNVDGLQTALDGKQATITGGASSIVSSNLTASRALVSDGSGKVAVSAVTSTEIGYLDGVTSALQTQLNGKASTSHTHDAADIVSGVLDSARVRGTTHGHSALEILAQYNRQSSTDLNTYLTSGAYGLGSGHSNAPTGMTFDPLLVIRSHSDVGAQMIVPRSVNRPIAYRGWSSSGTFYAWQYALWGSSPDDGSRLTSVDAATLGGLGLSPGTSAPVGEQVIRTRDNGYTYLGWINTVSGNNTTAPTRIYASPDAFIRYMSPANFVKHLHVNILLQNSSATLSSVDQQHNLVYATTSGITYTLSNTPPIGTQWQFHNRSTGNITIATGGNTVYWMDGGGAAPSTGNRTLARAGVATVVKIASGVFHIYGVGLS